MSGGHSAARVSCREDEIRFLKLKSCVPIMFLMLWLDE
jgi:hypothetical protein